MAEPAPVGKNRIETFGLDYVCEELTSGTSMRDLSKAMGVGLATLLIWIDNYPEHAARVRNARALAAQIWDERAEQVLIEAKDALGLQRARELAQHYRWRASKIAPREYGDKVAVEHSGELAVKDMSDAAVEARLAILVRTLGYVDAAGGEGKAPAPLLLPNPGADAA